MTHQPVASRRHSLVFLVIVAAVTYLGFAAQHRSVAGGGLVETHTPVLPLYASVIVLNGLLALFVWKGIRSHGVDAGTLIGGRWSGIRDVARDLAIALGFWGVFLASAWAIHALLGQGTDKTVDVLLPHTPTEVAVWLIASATAGFCEEFVFRGYVQRQAAALAQNTAIAVAAQGIVFGLMHAYQGWRAVVSITVLGILFGVLAATRRTLRPGMIAHAWQDVWAGWLSRIL